MSKLLVLGSRSQRPPATENARWTARSWLYMSECIGRRTTWIRKDHTQQITWLGLPIPLATIFS